jgi:hypothetical protein
VKERSEGGGAPKGEPRPSEARRPEKTQTPQQRGEGIRGVPPPEQKIVYTQEHYDRDQKEKSQLRHQFIRASDDDGEKWKTLGCNRVVFKRIREIERR